MSKQLYLKVVKTVDEQAVGIFIDVNVAKDMSYEVNKIVYLQKDLKTGVEDFVVFPKEHYEFRIAVMKSEIEAEIKRAMAIEGYSTSQESKAFESLINSTTKEMIFQDGY